MEKVCLVTGASQGIGAAIVRELALVGHMKVVLSSRKENKLKELVKGFAISENVFPNL